MEHEEDYLCHHGVKGMKWGVRKDRSKSSESKRSLRKQAKIQVKNAKKVAKYDKKINKLKNRVAKDELEKKTIDKELKKANKDVESARTKVINSRTKQIQDAFYIRDADLNARNSSEIFDAKNDLRKAMQTKYDYDKLSTVYKDYIDYTKAKIKKYEKKKLKYHS